MVVTCQLTTKEWKLDLLSLHFWESQHLLSDFLNRVLHIDLWYFKLDFFFFLQKSFNLLLDLILLYFCQNPEMLSSRFQGTFELVPILFVPLISCLGLRVLFCPEILLFINSQPLSHFLLLSCFHLFFFPLGHRKSSRRGRMTGEALPITHLLCTSLFSCSPKHRGPEYEPLC